MSPDPVLLLSPIKQFFLLLKHLPRTLVQNRRNEIAPLTLSEQSLSYFLAFPTHKAPLYLYRLYGLYGALKVRF